MTPKVQSILRFSITAVMVVIAAFIAMAMWRHYMYSPWTREGRLRAEVVRVRQEPFVESAKVIGVPTGRILLRHVLRNSTRSLPVVITLNASEALLTLAGLGFLGLGAQPPVPEWGLLIAEGRNYLSTAWWLTTLPGLAVIAVVLAANRISRQFSGERS